MRPEIALVFELVKYCLYNMGANSIDISQYRSKIGTFAGSKTFCNSSKVSMENKLQTRTVMECLIILSYLLVLSNITQQLLIMSGVELNPGPFDLGKTYFKDMRIFLKHI